MFGTVDHLSRQVDDGVDRRSARTPPGWLFHGLLILACLPVLWAASYPGFPIWPFLILGLLLLLGFGLVWSVRVILCLAGGVRPRWPLLVAQGMWCEVVPGGVLFHDGQGGGLMNDAGFAYLPNRTPTDLPNTLLQRSQYVRFGGGWYAWTASW